MRIKNFLFHRVSHDEDRLWPPMQPQHFERIIAHLTRTHQVVLLEDLAGARLDSIPAKKPLATVLFDDGYKDNIEYAAPILQKYSCPASFYVVTDCINRNQPTWTYIIDHAVQHTGRKTLELPFEYVPEPLKHLELASPGLKSLKPWMKHLPNARRLEIMDAVVEQCDDVLVPQHLMMSWEEIRQLQRAGFTIGSHSHTHPLLASLEDEKEIEQELNRSRQIIEQETGKTPLTISYPIGSFDQRVIRLSEQAGYQFGLAVEQVFFRPGKDPLMAIPRVELYQEPWWKTMFRISGLHQKLRRIRA